MAKDVTTVDGEETVVRADTAKEHRFLYWGRLTAGIGLGLMALLFAFFLMGSCRV